MRLLYFYRVGVPDPRADAIQIVNTCAGVARAGVDVALHVETLGAPSIDECLAFYGIGGPREEPAGSFDITALGRHWSWPLFHWKTSAILHRAALERSCLFVREVRPYVPGLMARAKAAGLRVIFEAHNVSASLVKERQEKTAAPGPLRRKALRRAALERSILGHADALICTQRATLEALRHLLKRGAPATVLGNGTQLPPPRPETPADIDVLYCGSLKQWKGVDTLVAAMRTLHPWKLTIVGPAARQDVERLRQAALAMGCLERVEILAPVRPVDVWDLYARAKVGVIPLPGAAFVEARDFTSPLKLFEMMAAGLPIVCSRLNSLQEYVRDGREALMVPPDDPRPLAEAIRRVLTDGALRNALAAGGRARAAEFTWDARGARIAALAQELLLGL